MIAGFDIGGTNARLRVFDDSFQVCHEAREKTRSDSSPQSIATKMRDMLAAAPKVTSVGVGIAGFLSADGRTVVNAPNLGWRDVAFAELLESALDTQSVALANDLNAMLYGELRGGAAQGARDVLAVYVGTGVGGALAVGGELVVGCGGKAGEIGHSKVVVGGRRCGCGELGCVEAYAGGVHLEQMVTSIAPDIGADLGRADAMYEANAQIQEIWERATDYLAIVVANSCTLLNPQVLLLGGGVLDNLERYRSLFLQKVTPLVLEAARGDLEVKFGQLDEAGVLGAALLATRTPR